MALRRGSFCRLETHSAEWVEVANTKVANATILQNGSSHSAERAIASVRSAEWAYIAETKVLKLPFCRMGSLRDYHSVGVTSSGVQEALKVLYVACR